MEQISMLEETLQTTMLKQMKKAIKKGIVPGVKVALDKDEEVIYTVTNMFCNPDGKLMIGLISKLGSMSWEALSSRLSVI